MTYAGRHRKTSPLKIAQRRAALTALVAGAVAAGGVAGGGVAGAAPSTSGTGAAGTADANGLAGGAADYVPAEAQAGVASGAETLVNIPGMPSAVSDILGPFTGSAALVEAVVKPAEGTLTSGYGPRWGTMHNGIDIANVQNTPIHAIMSGTVIDAGPASGYGQWIRIRHDDGAVTVYGHMETLAVSVGDRIGVGQYIAGMGNRGHSTGTHLHFEIHPDGNGAIDPEPWFAERGIHF